MNSLLKRRLRVKKRVRSKVQGTSERPRINVFRSNNYMYAQAIDDVAAKTLAAASDRAERKAQKLAKKESAAAVGKALAEKLVAMKITEAVFDRGYYKYTGRVQAVADAMREAKITI